MGVPWPWVCQLVHHVALAVVPRGVLDGIVSIGRGPHAEAAVVLGGEDDPSHARLLAHTRPLTAVEGLRVEQAQVFVAETPFLVGIGVHRVVDKCIHLHVLPTELVGTGNGPAGGGRCHLGFCRQGHNHHEDDGRQFEAAHKSKMVVFVRRCTFRGFLSMIAHAGASGA